MRNPLPVLAAAMLAAAGAFAGDLPTWTTSDGPTWREIDFTDGSGAYHSLYCPWSACPGNSKSGKAKLYVLERTGSVPYTTYVPYNAQYAETYAGKTWEWLKSKTENVPVQSAKTSYKSKLSRFVFDMGSNKAVIEGTDVALAIDRPHDSFDNVNPIWRVEQPSAVADDAPKPVPPKPQPVPTPKPKPKPTPTPTPKPKPHKPSTTQPAPPKPGAHAATELSVLERYWLIPTERTAYDDSVDASKKPAPAALQAAYKKGRDAVSANLRDELKAPYNTLVGGGQFDKIDALLEGKNYAGFEVALRPEEYEALKKVLKTADAHADFVAPNAAAQYDLEMKSILGPDGKAKLNEHVMAHRITEKFRAMLPKQPGQQVDPAAPLTDADWAKITDQKDRDALHKQYDADFAAADTPEKKAAVNKDYRAKIEDWVTKHKPATPPSTTPFDPASITTLDKLLALSPADQKKFCSGMSSDAGALANCGDILANADAATTKCMSEKGANPTATAKAKSDCMAKVNACKTSGGNAPQRTSMANLPKDMQTHCAKLLAGADGPPPTIGSGGGSAIDNSPCPGAKASAKGASGKDPSAQAGTDVDPCPKKDDKKDDPNFYQNLGNGIAFGIGGLLLASFFGGPLLMLGVALASGVGGYYFAKSNDEPKKKK